MLKEDRDRLVQLQKDQPRFSEQQKKELAEVHSWIKEGVLPEAIGNKVDGDYPHHVDSFMHGNLHAVCLPGGPGLFLLRGGEPESARPGPPGRGDVEQRRPEEDPAVAPCCLQHAGTITGRSL